MQNFQTFHTNVVVNNAGNDVAVIAAAIESILDAKNISVEEYVAAGGNIEFPNREIWLSLEVQKGGVSKVDINLLGRGIIESCVDACKELENLAVGPFKACYEDRDENTDWHEFYNDGAGDCEFEACVEEAVALLSGVVPGIGEVLPDYLRQLRQNQTVA